MRRVGSARKRIFRKVRPDDLHGPTFMESVGTMNEYTAKPGDGAARLRHLTTEQKDHHMIRLGKSSFRKSTHSGGNGACVEVGSQTATTVGVRDSKIEDSPVFTVAPGAWSAFLTLARTTR